MYNFTSNDVKQIKIKSVKCLDSSSVLYPVFCANYNYCRLYVVHTAFRVEACAAHAFHTRSLLRHL